MRTAQARPLPFVIFRIKGELYAISSSIVQEITRLPPVTGVPLMSSDVRGVINLRGKIIHLVDLRIRLGLPSLRTELDSLVQLLHDRERDHRDWLAELEACVKERRPFRLARDPHQCKFGRWYDCYRAEDRLLRMTLPSMDAPHKAIHATADAALGLAEKGDVAGALDLINSRRSSELAALIKLFNESRRILVEGHREVVMVLSRGADRLAISVDLVEAAEHIPAEHLEAMSPGIAGLIADTRLRIGRRARTSETILVFDDEYFFPSAA